MAGPSLTDGMSHGMRQSVDIDGAVGPLFENVRRKQLEVIQNP